MTDDGRMVQEAGCMIGALKSNHLNFCRVLYMVLHCDGGNWRYLCSLVSAEFFPTCKLLAEEVQGGWQQPVLQDFLPSLTNMYGRCHRPWSTFFF